MEIIVIIVLVVVVWIAISIHLKKKRRDKLLAKYEKRLKELLEKYGDAEVVEKIMQQMVWQGQTAAQLIDSLGSPVDVDRRVMKTKTKEVWKYNETGKGRYALRITVEDGEVVGWDNKS